MKILFRVLLALAVISTAVSAAEKEKKKSMTVCKTPAP